VPFRCHPVTFRHAVTYAGYCSGYLGDKGLSAALRMKQFRDRTSWQRHISECIPGYVESLDIKDSISCPHLLCPAVLHSEADLWDYLGDIHSTHKPDAGEEAPTSAGRGRGRTSRNVECRQNGPGPGSKESRKMRTPKHQLVGNQPPRVAPKIPWAIRL
jgi:hypothetical protein